MATPAELHFGAKARAWVKSAFAYGKRYATLESRVAALEATLAKQGTGA
jgi:hypothetical protein